MRIGQILILILAAGLPLSRAIAGTLSIVLVLLWITTIRPWKPHHYLQKSKLAVAITLYCSFTLLSFAWTTNIGFATSLISELAYLGLLIPAITHFSTKQSVNNTISAFLVGMGISQTIFWLMRFGAWPFDAGTDSDPTPFMNHIEYGVFLAITIAILITRINAKTNNKTHIPIYFIFLTSAIISLFIADSKSGILAFTIIIPSAFILYLRPTFRSITISLTTLAIILTLAFNFTHFENTVERSIKEVDEAFNKGYFMGPFGTRIGLIILSKDIILEHPLVGTGIGDNMDESRRILHEKYPDMVNELERFTYFHMHNQYLATATKTGFIGLALLALILTYALKLKIPNRNIKILSVLFTLCYASAFVGEPLWHKQFTTVLFSLFIGLFISSSIEPDQYNSDSTNNTA